jgi:hypothetical protein
MNLIHKKYSSFYIIGLIKGCTLHKKYFDLFTLITGTIIFLFASFFIFSKIDLIPNRIVLGLTNNAENPDLLTSYELIKSIENRSVKNVIINKNGRSFFLFDMGDRNIKEITNIIYLPSNDLNIYSISMEHNFSKLKIAVSIYKMNFNNKIIYKSGSSLDSLIENNLDDFIKKIAFELIFIKCVVCLIFLLMLIIIFFIRSLIYKAVRLLFSKINCKPVFFNIFIRSISILLLIISFSITIGSFLYPLELEPREGTNWIHALAFKSGINIYDHTRVAFINMNHGPFDSIFKFLISTFLPFLLPGMVIRLPQLLIPVFLFYSAYLILKIFYKKKVFFLSLFFSQLFYMICYSLFGNTFNLGRSDATYLLLIILAVIVFMKLLNSHKKINFIYMLIIGILLMSAILTNWRILPFVFIIFILMFSYFILIMKIHPKMITIYFLSFLLGGLIVFFPIISILFKFDFILYYKHFFGFFTNESGWGTNPAASIPFIIKTMLNIFIILQSVLLIFILFKSLVKKNIFDLICFFSYLFLFWIYTLSYYLNYGGGGIYYLMPIFLFSFYYPLLIFKDLIDFVSNLKLLVISNKFKLYLKIYNYKRLFISGFIIIILLNLKWGSIFDFQIKLWGAMNNAYKFSNTLTNIDNTSGILTEDIFLFKRKLNGQTIDMGDTIFSLYNYDQGKYFGEDFSRKISYYFQNFGKGNFIYVLEGYTSSKFLREYVRTNSYSSYLDSQNFFKTGRPGWNTDIKLWVKQ